MVNAFGRQCSAKKKQGQTTITWLQEKTWSVPYFALLAEKQGQTTFTWLN